MANSTEYVLVTDSAADLSEQQLQNMGVISLPLNVFMKESPTQPCTLRGKEFYDAIRSGQTACTSAANLSVFRDMIGGILKEGKDVLYLSFSSPLSCMCATARIAAEELREEFPDRRFEIVDTLCASMGQGLLVYFAAEQKAQGVSLDELAAYVTENRLRLIHWFTVDDLMFLKRGGRLSAVSAIAGSLLGIKPVLHVSNEGKLVPVSKVRGRKNSILELAKHYGAECKDKERVVFIAHADAHDDANLLRNTLIHDHGAKHVVIGDIGPVIGAHSGPGTVALFYLAESREA